MNPAITLRGLSKNFGQQVAVRELSLEVEEGEIFGLLGPNGSGKTTILNLICGLLRPTAGDARVKGFSPWREARAVRTLLGVVPQETALYEDLDARENLRYQYALYGRDLTRMEDDIDRVLRLMGLSERAGDRVSTYSGGMKRRLALGRALLHDPGIIFLDEPTQAVDVQSAHALWSHVKGLKERGKTVIVTTNVMSEADFLCDRIAILDRGRLIALDTPARLKASIGSDRVRVEMDQLPPALEDLKRVDPALEYRTDGNAIEIHVSHAAEKISSIVSQLGARGSIRRLEMRTPTLDDVFLSYTGRKLRD